MALSSVANRREPTVGELRDKIIVQKNTDVSDGQAGWTDAWKDYAVFWGRILPLSSNSMYLAKQVDARATHQIVIRYSLNAINILAGDRIYSTDRRGERVFIVESVKDMGNGRRWTEIMAIENQTETEL